MKAYTVEDRKQLQEFIAKQDTVELKPEENWVRVESLLSSEHREALFGSKSRKATYPASALCCVLPDGKNAILTKNTLVPPETKIVYLHEGQTPMYLPAVSGG